MRGPDVQSTSFPTASCSGCGKTVLTYICVEDGDGNVRRCVHCDTVLQSRLEWISADELESLGYYFGVPSEKSGKGCGGSGSCGSCSR